MFRINQHTAEHLHVQIAVKHLNQTIIGHARVWFEEHERNLSFGREKRLVALGIF